MSPGRWGDRAQPVQQHRQTQHTQPVPTQGSGLSVTPLELTQPLQVRQRRRGGPGARAAHGHSRACPQKQLSPLGRNCRALVKMQLLHFCHGSFKRRSFTADPVDKLSPYGAIPMTKHHHPSHTPMSNSTIHCPPLPWPAMLRLPRAPCLPAGNLWSCSSSPAFRIPSPFPPSHSQRLLLAKRQLRGKIHQKFVALMGVVLYPSFTPASYPFPCNCIEKSSSGWQGWKRPSKHQQGVGEPLRGPGAPGSYWCHRNKPPQQYSVHIPTL